MSIPVKTLLCPSLWTGVKSSLGFRWGAQKFVAEVRNGVPLLHSHPGESASRRATSVATWCFKPIFHCLSCTGDIWMQDLANLHPNSFTDIRAALNNIRSWNCFTDISWRPSCAVRRNLLPLSSGEEMEAAGFGNYRAQRCRIPHDSNLHLRGGAFYEVVSTWKPVGWIAEWRTGIWKEAVLWFEVLSGNLPQRLGQMTKWFV
jgi:hypothetical protein